MILFRRYAIVCPVVFAVPTINSPTENLPVRPLARSVLVVASQLVAYAVVEDKLPVRIIPYENVPTPTVPAAPTVTVGATV